MQFKPELIKKIKDYFDLNIYETKVWLSLLVRGVSSAGEISEISSVPRSRTYDVLESLEKKGFALEKIGKPTKYIAVKPSIIIDKLKNNIEKEAEEKIKILEKLKETSEYEEILRLHQNDFKTIKSDEISASIKGKTNIYFQMREIMEDAENSLYIVLPSFEIKSKLSMFSEIFSKLKKRRVDIKIITQGDEKEVRDLSKKLSVPIKSINVNGRFLIADNEKILFCTNPLNIKEEDRAIWINSSFFASSLSHMVELAWKN